MLRGRNHARGLVLAIIFGLATLVLKVQEFAEEKSFTCSRPKLDRSGSLSVPFVENRGQYTDKSLKYVAGIFRGAVAIRENEVVYGLLEGRKVEPKTLTSFSQAMAERDENNTGARIATFGVKYVDQTGQEQKISPKGREKSSTNVSDHRGNNSSIWQDKLRAWNSVGLGELWPGVEVELRAHEKNVEQLFYVSPQSKPEAIALAFNGIKRLSIDENGELLIEHELGKYSLTRPVAFQAGANGENKRVEVSYRLLSERSAGFAVGAYDRSA